MKLLHLLPSFEYTCAGRQVSLLAPFLLEENDIQIAALGPDGPIAESLRAIGVPVHILGPGRRFDPAAWWRFRRLVRDLRPDIVHAWRLPALRAGSLMRGLGKPKYKLVVSEPWRGTRTNPIDLALFRSADAVVTQNAVETDASHRAGVPAAQIHEVPLAVAPPAADPPPLGVPLPTRAKIIMCVGNLTPAHGFRDAIWAADILRYPVPDLHLVIVGDGPERSRLMQFARSINPAGGHVHFLSARPDAAALMARADVVWIPSRSECGRGVLLEALAAGRPVVASALPGSAALVADGRTGLLSPPGNPTELARRTRLLLDNPDLAARLGAAGREAAEGFTPERVAAAYAALYAAL